VRDEALRIACFSRLAILEAQFGEELPYRASLDEGFRFRGDRVPFLSPQKGIFRARKQSGPAALSITTSFSGGPYADVETEEGFVYSYRAGPIEQPDNVALREAHILGIPIVYFIASRPGFYEAIYPCFIRADDPGGRVVLVDKGRMRGDYDEPEPAVIEDPLEQRYVNRDVRVRVHQRRFRWRVLPAYRNRCAICQLREVSLLDAAHITADADVGGEPAVSNGLSLCSMHHRTFDQDLVGVTPDYVVRISPRLLDETDGPMLILLQDAHDQPLLVPRSAAFRPDKERLATRYERFLERGA
jgi:putative restriction endonuclease